jgi:broad specificity phosphatase PhoE
MSETDEAWSVDYRETLQDIDRRIERFLNWLVSLPQMDHHDHHEQEQQSFVVVVSHGVWMECLLRKFDALANGQRVYNTDAYALRLHSCVDDSNGQLVVVRASHIEQIHSSIGQLHQ